MKTNQLCLILIILFLIGFGSGYYCSFLSEIKNNNNIYLENEVKRDTIVELKHLKPIILYKTKLKILKTSDTIIQSNPFVAKLDTIIQYDTIRAGYEFPNNFFSLELKRKPDTLKIQTIEKIKSISENKPWWETPAYVATGVVLGYLIGKAK